ncbi:unnamed protein product [Bathycoccus prasinos]
MFGGHKQQKGGSSYSFSSSNVTIDNKHPVTERADSLSMSGSPPLQRPNFVEEEVVQEEEEDVLVVKMKQKVLLLKQELKAKDDMLEAVQSQAKLDIVNARTRVDSIEEKREELEARCAKAEKLALERTNALETANKKLKEAERSAKVFMQRANAKISEALRENDSTEGPSPSSSSSKVERKMTPSNLSLQEKILRIERQQQMEDEEGLLKKNSNSNTKKKKKNNKEESSSSLVAVNNDDDEVEEEEEENKEEETKSEKQSVEEVEALRWEIQQLLTQNADAARSFQNSLEIERNKRREAEERAEISEATCVRLQSELKSKESLLKMMEKTSSTSMMRTTFTAALQTRTLNTTEKNKKNQHLVDSKFDDAEEEDSDEDEIPLFSSPPVLKSPIPPLVSRK